MGKEDSDSAVSSSWLAENDSSDPGYARAGDSSGQPDTEGASDSLFCSLLADTRATTAAVATPVGMASLMVCCLVMSAVLKFQPQNKPGYNSFLVSLTCSGILQGFAQLLIASINFSDKLFSHYHSSQNFCLVRIALSHTAHVSSINNVWLIAVDHYLYLVQPLDHYRYITERNTLASIVVSWFCAIGYGLLAFGVKINPRYRCCAVTEAVPRYYEYYIPLGHYIACLAFCGFVYGTISCVSLRFRRQESRKRFARQHTSSCRNQGGEDRSVCLRTRKIQATLQSYVTNHGLKTLQILPSLRFSLAVMVPVLGVWGSYFLSRMWTEVTNSSNTFGSHENCDWSLSLVSLSTVLLCCTYAYINTEIRKSVFIFVLGRKNGMLDVNFMDFSLADMIYTLLHSLNQAAENIPESESQTSLAVLAIVQKQPTTVESYTHKSGSTATLYPIDTAAENTAESTARLPL